MFSCVQPRVSQAHLVTKAFNVMPVTLCGVCVIAHFGKHILSNRHPPERSESDSRNKKEKHTKSNPESCVFIETSGKLYGMSYFKV